MAHIEAKNNYVVFQEIDAQGPDPSTGLRLPDSVKRNPRWGRVLSVGAGVPDFNGRLVPPDVAEGDVVYVAAHGKELLPLDQLGGEPVHVASVLDILGMVNETTLDFTPLGDLIVIEKIEPPREDGGVLLADSAVETPAFGRVIKLGKGWASAEGRENTFQVAEGDVIAYVPLQVQIVDYVTLGHERKIHLVKHGNVIGVVRGA